MKKSLACILTLLTVLLCASAQAQTPQDTAANYQGDSAHTGFVNSPGLAPPFKKKWTVNFGREMSYPVIGAGKVFVTVRNASAYGTGLYAIDAATGATAWGPVALGGSYYWSALAYENGRVFAVNGSGMLTAFDAATGAVAWTRQLPGQYSFDSAPTAYNGVIYTGGSGSGGTLYAVSAANGTVLWTAGVANGDNSSPALTADGLYVSYACAMSYKFNPTTGAQLWRFSTGCSGGGGKTAVYYKGRLYVRDGSTGNKILDGTSGANLGTFNSRNAPAFAGNLGFFTAGSTYLYENLKLEARDLGNNNALVWSFAGDGYLRSAPLVIDNHVLVGSDTGMLYALDTQTGNKVWSMNLGGGGIPYVDEHNVSQPLTGFAAGAGLLVVPTKTTLVALETEADRTAPKLQWGEPQPAPLASGWNNTPVDIPYTTVDDLSAVVNSSAPNPLRIAADGANQTRQVTVTDEAGNSATFTSPAVNIDMTSPVTTASASGPAGSGQWYTGAAQITLAATDNLSGLLGTFVEIDGGTPQPYGGPFVISRAGNHAINYWSVDKAGNTEQPRTLNVGVDNAAPTTQFSAAGNAGGGWFRTGPLTVTLTAGDDLSGAAATYYSVNGGPAQTYAGPFDFRSYGQGRHTVSYWSVDKAGNTEAAQSSPVNVDYTGPDTQSSVSGTVGGALYYRSAVKVTLTPMEDNLSGVGSTFYRVDDGPTQTYTGPFTISADGVHPVEFWSVDVAGNHNYTGRIGGIHIDTTPPETQASVVGTAADNGWYKGPVQITLTSSDAQSGVRYTFYSIDNGQTQYYSAPFTVSAEGAHTVRVWSMDEASNTDPQQSLVVNIDTTAPQTRAYLGGVIDNGWWRGSANVRLYATDAASSVGGIFYTVDGGATQTYTADFNVTGDGSHTVRFWSVDVAGTAEAPQTLAIPIDGTAPQTQAAAVGAPGDGGWYRGAVQVTLSAVDATSQVKASFFAVDGGAAQAYSAPFAVTGDGSHTVRFWSVDQAGNAEASKYLTLMIDGTAPQTQASAAGPLGDNGWYKGPVQVTLSASDNLTNVSGTYFTVDGGATQTYGGPFTVSGNGVHTVNLWSKDGAGNAGAPQTLTLGIDSGVPVINIAATPSTAAKSKNNANFTITGLITDAPSGVRAGSTTYSVADEYGVAQPSGAVTLRADGTYSFTLSLPATRNVKDADGHRYTVTVRAADAAGNSGSVSVFVTIQ
ncbi:MAG TPA: PQQ-binding-like beta-propeller repeat protein [Pyrinomonadaceae bacterium]|jgi:outer membrane protein assembly factor BamB|nr:PQQ-binding-like beta-propeller repeat protein [Pyrinomonadaceae bacterium]